MTWQGWLQIVVFAALITAAVRPFGGYISSNVIGGGHVQRTFAPLERGLYWLAGVDPDREQSWIDYALAILWFHLVGIAVLYALLRLQSMLPLNPQQFDAVVAGPGAQHRRQLRHQHELAVLRRRSDTRLSGTDGGHRRAVVPLRRDRGRRGDRPGARFHAPFVGRRSATSGSM